ncbi:MAG: hypothetical protein RJA69_1329 [Pseudomonadota bacterium]|jgi:hypothetical protein
MRVIKKARRLILNQPQSLAAQTLSKLILSLENETEFSISDLYRLDLKEFEMAISLLEEWRLDRYYEGKAKLFDLSMHYHQLVADAAKPSASK